MKILLVHGAGVFPRNSGDDAQAFAAAERLERLIPGAQVILARMYLNDDGFLWPDRPQVPSLRLYLTSISTPSRLFHTFLRQIGLSRIAFLYFVLRLVARAARSLFAAHIAKRFNIVPLLDPVGREAIRAMLEADAVYCSGGGNLNDIWLFQELFPRTVTYRVARALGKPVVLSGQGVGPVNSSFGKKALTWGLKHVKFFGCRDKSESAQELLAMGLRPEVVATCGDDAMDLRSAGKERGREILDSEGVPNDGAPLLAFHVRFTNFSSEFGDQGLPFVAKLCDLIIEKTNCRILFLPITQSESRIYDRDLGDALEVFCQMRRRDRAMFLARQRYTPSEVKAAISCCTSLVGFSYHAWVFALTNNLPAFALYQGEYFRKKSAGLFEWYNHMDWIWDIGTSTPEQVSESVSKIMIKAKAFAPELETANQKFVASIVIPAKRLRSSPNARD